LPVATKSYASAGVVSRSDHERVVAQLRQRIVRTQKQLDDLVSHQPTLREKAEQAIGAMKAKVKLEAEL